MNEFQLAIRKENERILGKLRLTIFNYACEDMSRTQINNLANELKIILDEEVDKALDHASYT